MTVGGEIINGENVPEWEVFKGGKKKKKAKGVNV